MDKEIPVEKNDLKKEDEESEAKSPLIKKRVRPTILNRTALRPIPLALSIPSPSVINTRAGGQSQGPIFALKNHRIKLAQYASNMDKLCKSIELSNFTGRRSFKSFKNNSIIGTNTNTDGSTGIKKKFQIPSVRFTNTLAVSKKVGNFTKTNSISTSSKFPKKSALKQPTDQVEGWPKMREQSDNDDYDAKNANRRVVHYSESLSDGQLFKELGEFKKKTLPQKNLLLTNGVTYFGLGSNGENILPTYNNFSNFNSNSVDRNWRSNENRFRTTVNMAGFEDDEISFGCETNRLFITGMKMKPDKVHARARKVTEIVQLPDRLLPDKLQILKDSDGLLHIEEIFLRSKYQ